MDERILKADVGGKIMFWGGIDTRYLPPEGSEQDVKNADKLLRFIKELMVTVSNSDKQAIEVYK